MSVQSKDYTSKRTGKTKRRYYATVWDAGRDKAITGAYRDTEKKAKMDETDITRDIAEGCIKKRRAGMTIEQVSEVWLESSAPPVYSNSTHKVYTYYYKHFISPVFGEKAVNKVSAAHIQKYVNEIKKQYAEETVNKCITVLVDVFGFALEPLGEITVNPAALIKRVKVPKKKRNVWTDDTVQYFLSLPEIVNSEYYAMFCISLVTGARPGEVCGLEEKSLIASPRSISFDRGYDRYGKKSDMKTNGSHRSFQIPEELYKTIRHRLLWKKKEQLADPDFAENDFLFVSDEGNPIRPDRYSKMFHRLVAQHNKDMEDYEAKHKELPEGHMMLPPLTLYGCRHSFATSTLAKGNDAALVSSVMGNSVKTLLEFYAHPYQEQQLSLINEQSDKILQKTYQSIS